jgi:hypothetical protein
MVGHQAVGIYSAAEFLFKKGKIFPVVIIIVIGCENNLAVMSALDNVMRSIRKDYSG